MKSGSSRSFQSSTSNRSLSNSTVKKAFARRRSASPSSCRSTTATTINNASASNNNSNNNYNNHSLLFQSSSTITSTTSSILNTNNNGYNSLLGNFPLISTTNNNTALPTTSTASVCSSTPPPVGAATTTTSQSLSTSHQQQQYYSNNSSGGASCYSYGAGTGTSIACGSTPNNSTSRKRMWFATNSAMDTAVSSYDDQTHTSQGGADRSTTSSGGVSSTVDIDSMRPVVAPRAKRRRTGILDAFNSISLVARKKSNNNTTKKSSRSKYKKTNGKKDSNMYYYGSNNNTNEQLSGSGCGLFSSAGGYKYSISAADQGTDDADSSQAVADEADNVGNSSDCYSSTGSSLGDDDYSTIAAAGVNGDDFDDLYDNDLMYMSTDNNATTACSNRYDNKANTGYDDGCSTEDDDDPLLSDAELVIKKQERKVMLELVFGPNSEFVPHRDPVDVKLKEMIQKSLVQASNNNPNILTSTTSIPTQTQDDISIMDYSSYGSGSGITSASHHTSGTNTPTFIITPPSPKSQQQQQPLSSSSILFEDGQRFRSNSLPDNLPIPSSTTTSINNNTTAPSVLRSTTTSSMMMAD